MLVEGDADSFRVFELDCEVSLAEGDVDSEDLESSELDCEVSLTEGNVDSTD